MGFYQKGKYRTSKQSAKSFKKKLKRFKKMFPKATNKQIARVIRLEQRY